MSDYTTPPPPPPPPPPVGSGPGGAPAGGKDNSQLIGIIGIVLGFCCCWPAGVGLGIWSLIEANKKGGNKLWAYLAFAAAALNLIGTTIYWFAFRTNS